jgi:hypothetical protein
MEQTAINATVFGAVLGELMESRGISPEPQEVRALAERSGLDPDALLTRVRERWPDEPLQALCGIDLALGLTEPEKARIAVAYVYDRDYSKDCGE